MPAFPHHDPPTVLIMAGGTGGHIFPALATAAILQARGCRLHWLGTPASMEAQLVPQHGFALSVLPVTGLRGQSLAVRLQAPWRLAVSLWRAIRVLRRLKPHCVLGMGGYVTGPGGLAAKLLGIPLVIHEQNAVPGLTNRLLAKLATRVLAAFPGTFSKSNCPVFTTGNPVRAEIAMVRASTIGDRIKTCYRGDRPLQLLVLGGSRGAAAINALMLSVGAHCRDHITLWHQTGQTHINACRAHYAEYQTQGIKPYRVEPFIADMAAAYQWADLVVCRAGALTVAELAMVGRPAILIPYPHAVDDHQTINGRYLVDQGAALMIPQAQLTKAMITSLLLDFTNDPDRLATMAKAARSMARPQATVAVADHCLAVCHG